MIMHTSKDKNIRIGRIKLSFAHSYGRSNAGYIHLPILYIGFGKNGFGIYILGGYIGFAIIHKHKWQTRATNKWGKCTYRVCLTCGDAEKWEGFIDGDFVKCERLPEFDSQFDNDGNYIL